MSEKQSAIFGLLDCNNFFVSCERVFQPKLAKLPVLVLSNNDGCVVSRSNEVKALNIKMGIPVFKIKDLIRTHHIKVFSSNFTLYGDMSRRVMEALNECVPSMEIYSIDEAFLDLTGFNPKELTIFGRNVINTVSQWTGVPLSLGIAPTKTLTKVANLLAKKDPRYCGVVNILPFNLKNILLHIPVADIWGVGRGWSEKLKQLGIVNAYQLSEQDPAFLQKRFNRILAATALELKGTPVHEIEQEISPRKQIIVSRSFGKTITKQVELREALAAHTTRAVEKLRADGSVASVISIFLQTSRFSELTVPYHHSVTIEMATASQDTRVFLKAALKGLNKLYSSDLQYKKAGVILMAISPKCSQQLDLFSAEQADDKSECLMDVLDEVNEKIGRGTMKFAVEGYQKEWRMRAIHRSPNYVSEWGELLLVR